MTIARPLAGPAGTGGFDLSAALGRSGWPIVVAVWAAYAVFQIVTGFPEASARMSTDDAMRLVEVRDLMNGQGWFDLTQHRLNPPDGVAMHWSRLVDLPVAVILSLSERLFEAKTALNVTLTLWPQLMFLAALLAGASAASAIAGPGAGALSAVMFVMSPGVTTHFGPGAIDHHNVQIALTLSLVACAIRLARSDAAAIAAGLVAAAMMAIGMETAPHVAACAGLIAFRWAIVGEPMARGARRFGLAFAGGAVVVALLTVAPERWSAPVCDALGIGQIVAAVMGGLGLAAATASMRSGPAIRLAALACVGAATLPVVAAVAPDCLSAPYASLPVQLRLEWLSGVEEAQSFAATTFDDPTSAAAIGFALFGVMAVALWALLSADGETRWRVGMAAAMLAVACLVTGWQIRGASLAFALGGVLLPMAALALGLSGGRARLALAVAGLSPMTVAAAGLGAAHAVGLPPNATRGESHGMCPDTAYQAFAAMPAGLALNTIDTGPFILANTPHSAVAAPYHRNVDGIAAALDAFNGSEETARAVALSRGAAYVVGCATDGGLGPIAKRRPESFSARLLAQPAPDWLVPVDLGPDTPLRVWRVKSAAERAPR